MNDRVQNLKRDIDQLGVDPTLDLVETVNALRQVQAHINRWMHGLAVAGVGRVQQINEAERNET
jgi:hypothetical protein